MPLPSFTVTGNLNDILAIPAAGEIDDEPWTDAYLIFASNIEDSLVVWAGEMYNRPPPVRATVADDGSIEIEGAPVELLANDPGLNVAGVRWRCDVKTSPNTIIASFWFEALSDGETLNLASMVPTPGVEGGIGVSNTMSVIVTTGSEPRPSALVVLWIDTRATPTPPTNMLATDLHVTLSGALVGGGDTEAPTVPTGLAEGTVTSTTIEFSWDASTDNVAVTRYAVRLDSGTAIIVTSGLTYTFEDLIPDTEYQIDVRAGDAAGNWSLYCDPITVSTPVDPLVPASRFNFNEGTGTTATSVTGGYVLNDNTSGSQIWGTGTIKTEMLGYINGSTPASTFTDWTMAIDLVLPSIPGTEKTLLYINKTSSIFVNILNDGKIKWYGASTVTSSSSITTGNRRLVVVQSSTTTKVYVDGTEFISSAQVNDYPRPGALVQVQYLPPTGLETDTLRFWTSALSPAEVSGLGA